MPSSEYCLIYSEIVNLDAVFNGIYSIKVSNVNTKQCVIDVVLVSFVRFKTNLTCCFGVSIVEFEQVNAGWVGFPAGL